jgi:hypothetical protein
MHLFTELDGVSAPSGKQDTVAGLDGRRDHISLFVERTGADGDDRGLGQRTRSCTRGKEDSRGGFLPDYMSIIPTWMGETYGIGLEPLDEHAVQERNDSLDRLERHLRGLSTHTNEPQIHSHGRGHTMMVDE